MAKVSKQAQEKLFKEEFMNTLLGTLSNVNMEPSRINDYGTIAIPVQINGEDRYMTLKVVLTKAYDEEKGTGFDIFETESAYLDRVKADEEKAKAKEAKAKDNLEKRAKTEAKREAEDKTETEKEESLNS